MKKHLTVLGLTVAYGLMIKWMVIPFVNELLTPQDRSLGLFLAFVGWGIAFVTTSINVYKEPERRY